MERVFQRSFKVSHCHTIGDTRITFGGKNTIIATKAFLVFKTFKAGKAVGCDEILPEMLRPLNQGVVWLTRVCQVAWCSGMALKHGQTGVIIPVRKNGDRSEYINYRGISLLNLPRKVHAKCFEKRCREIMEPKVDDVQRDFCPYRIRPDQLYTFQQIFKNILGICQRRLHMFCRPRESTRPGSS